MECDVCGSHNVARRQVEGRLLEVCNLCGNLQGDDEAVLFVEEMRRGRKRGLDDPIIPLVTAFEGTGAFQVVQATAGDAEVGEAPAVFFRLAGSNVAYLERLLKSLELANRQTKFRWLVELSLQYELVFILRPRFWKPPQDVTAEEIAGARADLEIVARNLRRDAALSWWRA